MPSGATSGGVGGSVSSASLLKLQQQQQQQTVPLQQQQQSTNAPQPPFNQVNKSTQLNVIDGTKFREYITKDANAAFKITLVCCLSMQFGGGFSKA